MSESSADILARFVESFAEVGRVTRYRSLLDSEAGLRKFSRAAFGALCVNDACTRVPSLGAQEHVTFVVDAFECAGVTGAGGWVDSSLVARSYDDLASLLSVEACSGYPMLVEGVPGRVYYYEGEGADWRWVCGVGMD